MFNLSHFPQFAFHIFISSSRFRTNTKFSKKYTIILMGDPRNISSMFTFQKKAFKSVSVFQLDFFYFCRLLRERSNSNWNQSLRWHLPICEGTLPRSPTSYTARYIQISEFFVLHNTIFCIICVQCTHKLLLLNRNGNFKFLQMKYIITQNTDPSR